jgi:hypothetical protein
MTEKAKMRNSNNNNDDDNNDDIFYFFLEFQQATNSERNKN